MKKYQIIYADPPWKYRQGKSLGTNFQAAADRHYPCMDYKDICKLPIRNLADEKCILFMWATYPMLREALEVIKEWGFEYKTVAFTWLKTYPVKRLDFVFGVGYYTKSNAEVCLLATKGEAHKLVKSNSVSQVIVTIKTKHSEKPQEARDKIVQLVGGLSRIELFARQKAEGWDAIGDEIDGQDIKETLEKMVK
jgi:site-specific DNA-methyltransferase (adenine-specific)